MTRTTLKPDQIDLSNGLSTDTSSLSFVVNGVTALDFTEASGHVIPTFDVVDDINPDDTITQGNVPLTATYNITDLAHGVGASMTLPPHALGKRLVVMNNGISAVSLFPAVGDFFEGIITNSAITINPNLSVTVIGATDGWMVESWGGGIDINQFPGSDVPFVQKSGDTVYGALDFSDSGGTNGPLILNELASSTNPVFCPLRTTVNTGVGGNGSAVSMIVGGTQIASAANSAWQVTGGNGLFMLDNNGARLVQEASSNTNPTVIPDRASLSTGLGGTSGALALVANSVTASLYTEASSHVLQAVEFQTGITANAGGGQGSATQLVSSYNDVTTVASAGDSVKLPTAVAGLKVYVYNATATAMDIFPNTSDNLGQGVDTAVALTGPAGTMFVAIDATNWRQWFGPTT